MPRETLGPVAGDLEFDIAVPEGAVSDPALPALDVSGVPGAVVVARRGFVEGGVTLRAACVRAPSDRWAPGVEDLVLERATAIAAASAPGISDWSATPVVSEGRKIEQDLEGRGKASARGFIHHELAFGGSAHDVALCSIVCTEAASDNVCKSAVHEAALRGTFASPPDPSLGVRAILLAAERPFAAGALGGALALGAVAALLAKRPRPRR